MWARLAMLVLFLLASFPESGATPGLFGAGAPLDAAQVSDTPESLRARSAGLNLSVVEQARQQLAAGQAPAPVLVDLFPDVQLTARFSRLELSSAGGITLAGKIDGDPFSEIHLSQVGSAFFASLNTRQGLFCASSSDGQTARIWQVDPASFPKEDEVKTVTTEAGSASVEPYKDGQATFTHPLAPALEESVAEFSPTPGPSPKRGDSPSGARSAGENEKMEIFCPTGQKIPKPLDFLPLSFRKGGWGDRSDPFCNTLLDGGGSIFSLVCGGMPPQTSENKGNGGCSPLNLAQGVSTGPSTVDDGSRVDVYVGYTTAAKNAAGGLNAMLTLINTAIAETNSGYANSGILQQVTLVGSGEYAYDEAGFNWSTTLDRWQNPADAVFGPAHALRETNKADEMVLLVANTGFCGLGYLMLSGFVDPSFSSYSFALVAQGCATGYYSFAHEMGHNMGAMHNREAGSAGAFAYSYGSWIWVPANNKYTYRTVMAYDTKGYADQNGSVLNYSSQRVNYWSNPLAYYAGQPTGKDIADPRSANNALTLNNTAAVVARFRDGPAPAAPAGLTAVYTAPASITLNWTASGTDLTRNHVERSPVSSESWAEIAVLAPTVNTYIDSAFPACTALRYRVLSDNGNGRSAAPEAAAGQNLALTILGPYSARLDWANTTSGILNLYVERAEAVAGVWTRLGTLSPAAATFTDSAVPDGKAYRYRVLVENCAGIFSSSLVTLPAFPPAPGGLAVSGLDSTSARVDWAIQLNAQDTFIVERAPAAGAFAVLASIPGSVASYSDSSLPANADYRYRVTARNGRGDAVSNPVNLPAAPGNFHPVYPAAPGLINLAWVDNSALESGYSLGISTNGGSSWTPLTPAAESAQVYSYDTRVCGLNAQYRLRAVSGAGQSASLTAAAVSVPCQPMPAAVTSATRLYLSWPDVAGESGYLVEVWASPGQFDIADQGSLPAGSTSYLLRNLKPLTTVRLRVKAVNAAGVMPSAEITATTKKMDLFFPLLSR